MHDGKHHVCNRPAHNRAPGLLTVTNRAWAVFHHGQSLPSRGDLGGEAGERADKLFADGC
jgi:hypothetical protein